LVYAQASIAGVVKDTSGAVLPGVTVEAASPALIEKVRTVVTDGTGQYKIDLLRPGTYSVTFTLLGFNTVKREGIELTGAFTATINAEMRVGALEETIVVTGETPTVDVQSTIRQHVLTQQVLDAIPASRVPAQMAALIPGVVTSRKDVGGLLGDTPGSGTFTLHGNSDIRMLIGGVSIQNADGGGQNSGYGNLAAYQEVAVDTGGITLEQAEGGVRLNLVPRDGGNTVRGSFLGAFANGAMQSSNFTQELRDRGLGTPDTVRNLWDVNPAFGGPIKRDRIWFHGTMRYMVTQSRVPVFFNKHAGNPNVWIYEPDTDREAAWTEQNLKNGDGRVTFQATTKNKVAFGYARSHGCECPRTLPTTSAPEAVNHPYFRPRDMFYGDWTAPLTDRLLLEAAFIRNYEVAGRNVNSEWAAYYRLPEGEDQLRMVGTEIPRLIQVTEQVGNFSYRAGPGSDTHALNENVRSRAAASYITGAHAVKAGVSHEWGNSDQLTFSPNAAMTFRVNNGVPNQLTLFATPFQTITSWHELGLFVQDRWTVRRWTLTGGVRYDYRHSVYPGVTVGPGEFAPARNIVIPTADGPRWHDLSPRGGLAVDLLGDGKTALKVSLGKYLAPELTRASDFGRTAAPVQALVLSTGRAWTDANNNFAPDCDLLNPNANGECGAMANRAFGTVDAGRPLDRQFSRVDPDAARGWGRRSANWQFSFGVQRELLPRVSLDVSFFRTWWQNHIITVDRALTAADFDLFSITAPAHPSLPGGGGYVVSGFYDVKPAKFGVPADQIKTFAKNFGEMIDYWQGVDISVNAQPRPGLMLQGGASTGGRTTDRCEIREKVPEIALTDPFCRIEEKLLTQVKLFGSYLVPRLDVRLSAAFRNEPGPERLANYTASSAEAAVSLGRNLAGGARNVTVSLVERGTLYGERMTQLDLRVAKILRLGRTRTTLSVDLYNALNGNAVLAESPAFLTWLQPQNILNARFAKVGLQLDF
jgi:hypothetical protein